MPKGGALKPVYIVADDELEINGGDFVLQQGPALKVRGFTLDSYARKRIQSSAAQPVYVVSGANAPALYGDHWRVIAGEPVKVLNVTNAERNIIQGPAIPVYPVDDNGDYDATFAGYIFKVLNSNSSTGYDPSSLIGFWPQNESVGIISSDYSGFGHNGAYVAITLGQSGVPGMGFTSAFYNGAASYNNIYSAQLAAAFNGNEGTILAWLKMNALATWTDGIRRDIVMILANGNNFVTFRKAAANNRIEFYYSAGGVLETISLLGASDVDWIPAAITWSKSADRVKAYWNNSEVLPDRNTLGIWAGLPAITTTLIGASTTAPTFEFHGWLGPVLLYTEALTLTELQYLGTV